MSDTAIDVASKAQANCNGEIETPNQMRAEIFRLSYHHPVIRRVMDMCDREGHSSEDRYTMLAFWLIKDNIAMREQMMELVYRAPPKPVFVDKPHGPVRA